jgi:hypothetical protein
MLSTYPGLASTSDTISGEADMPSYNDPEGNLGPMANMGEREAQEYFKPGGHYEQNQIRLKPFNDFMDWCLVIFWLLVLCGVIFLISWMVSGSINTAQAISISSGAFLLLAGWLLRTWSRRQRRK